MKQGTLDQPAHINPDRLHEEMKAVLGDKYESMDTGVKVTPEALDHKIIIRLTDAADEADQQKAEAVLAKHDPTLLSTRQQREKDHHDAFQRLLGFDFEVLRQQKEGQQLDTIIDLLQDIQKMMLGANRG